MRQHPDSELSAINRILRILRPMEIAQRQRVLRYLLERVTLLGPGVTSVSRPNGQDELQIPQPPP
jgi:hypothetical protein